MRRAGIHFVSRITANAAIAVEEALPVQQTLPDTPAGRIQVLREQRITLGSRSNHQGAVLRGLRRVVAVVPPLPAAARRGATPVTHDLVTDRWDLSAEEVVQTYLWRWQIELFFRWLKSHVRLLPVLGFSQNAVELSVYLTLLTHLLTVLAAAALGLGQRSPALLRKCPRSWTSSASSGRHPRRHRTTNFPSPDGNPGSRSLPKI